MIFFFLIFFYYKGGYGFSSNGSVLINSNSLMFANNNINRFLIKTDYVNRTYYQFINVHVMNFSKIPVAGVE